VNTYGGRFWMRLNSMATDATGHPL
jgi:hypothetical protein